MLIVNITSTRPGAVNRSIKYLKLYLIIEYKCEKIMRLSKQGKTFTGNRMRIDRRKSRADENGGEVATGRQYSHGIL